MPHVSDVSRNVFQEAHNTVLDNFTADELARIDELATRLRAIIEAAKKRQKDRLG